MNEPDSADVNDLEIEAYVALLCRAAEQVEQGGYIMPRRRVRRLDESLKPPGM